MLFHSFAFLFVFLPVTLAVTALLLASDRGRLAVWWLLAASLFFYGWWRVEHLWIMLGSIAFNYGVGIAVSRRSGKTAKAWLAAGILGDLAVLGWFKYRLFFAQMVASGGDLFAPAAMDPDLPIGISFFTFTQIAFLVDCYRYKLAARHRADEYGLFVTVFPHLLAGPIIHHAQVVPQFSRLTARFRSKTYVARFLAPGLALLAIGLAKKVILADQYAIYADSTFAAASGPLSILEAWGGATAYTLQIYYDFSGYSDMAIGIALMLCLRLPVNFLSPYKAASIIDFWRRWHITLSQFLRDYLYIPLGGNRHGEARRYLNLLITMVLGGFWHGANWTYLLWGAMHGTMLATNHLLHRWVRWRPPVWLAVPVTTALVVFAWVPFRAPGLAEVATFWRAMAGFDGILLPVGYARLVPDALANLLHIRGGEIVNFMGMQQALLTILGFVIVWGMPNSMALLRVAGRRYRSVWLPAGLGVAMAMALVLMLVRGHTTFLYFQF